MTRGHAGVLAVPGLLASVLVAGCSGADDVSSNSAARSRAIQQTLPSGTTPTPGSSLVDRSTVSAPSERSVPVQRPRPRPEPRRSRLSIPAIGLRWVPVVRYTGTPDDAEGTRIQNRGPTASPRGPHGGVGPGEVGNFIVTGHRTSHSAPFRRLTALRNGHLVRVRSGTTVFVYRVTATRSTSFRSQRSRAEQSAAVPGRPGADAVRAMITLSTCATPEDHAAGNYWSDRFGNPEHRIDKVAVLTAELRTGSRRGGRRDQTRAGAGS